MQANYSLQARRGFTLVELLVYIVLAAVVVLIAGRIYVDSVGFRIATLDKLKSFSGVNEMSMVLQEDLFRIGLKGYMQSNSVALSDANIQWNSAEKDFSSFHHIAGGAFDELQFKTAVYSATGAITDSLLVRYWVNNKTLWRTETSRQTGATPGVAQAMLTDVDSFKVELGEYLADSTNASTSFAYENANLTLVQVDGASNVAITNNVVSRTLTGFVAKQISELTIGSGFVMEPGVPYSFQMRIGFNEPVFLNFNPSKEYMAFTLRELATPTAAVTGIADVPFYPGGDAVMRERQGEFILPGTANKTMVPVLRLLCDGSCSQSNAEVTVGRVRIWKHSLNEYVWWPTLSSDAVADPADISIKNRVKAVRVTLAVNKRGEITKIRKVIPTPNNGV